MTKAEIFYVNYKEKSVLRFKRALKEFRDSNKKANDYYWFMYDMHMSMRPGGLGWAEVHDLLEEYLEGEIEIKR
tara:strand:- start:1979 stop:2200 length:222 start_codon:yes stop_codon:yes gene_type:complete